MKMEILNLGKLIVKELESDGNVDTLSKWMAHFIAEQIVLAENSSDEMKIKVEEKCFDTILKLWENISNNQKLSPFKNLHPVFESIVKINPDNMNNLYFQSDYEIEIADDDLVAKYINQAKKVDVMARIWISYLFQLAAKEAVDERTIEWVEAALPMKDNIEMKLILQFMSIDELVDKEINPNIKINYYKKRIKELKDFKILNDELIKLYEKEYKALEITN